MENIEVVSRELLYDIKNITKLLSIESKQGLTNILDVTQQNFLEINNSMRNLVSDVLESVQDIKYILMKYPIDYQNEAKRIITLTEVSHNPIDREANRIFKMFLNKISLADFITIILAILGLIIDLNSNSPQNIIQNNVYTLIDNNYVDNNACFYRGESCMFYKTLTNLCKENNTSITSVVKDLGLSSSKVTAWKNGSIPKGDVLSKIADYFGVTTDYLLGRTDSPTPPKTVGVTIVAMDGDGQEEIRVTKEQYNKIKKLLEIMDEDNK